MSGAQHLIENAVHCIEEGQSYEDFANASVNKYMSNIYKISLDDVWGMAMQVVCTMKLKLGK